MPGRDAVVGSLLAACFLFSGVSPAQDAANNTQLAKPLQQQIVDALASGKDASGLIAQFKAQQTGPRRSPMAPRSEVFAELQANLVELEQAIQLGRTEQGVVAVLRKYEGVLAANLLAGERFEIVEQQLADERAANGIVARNTEARAAHARIMGQLDAALGPLLSEWQADNAVSANASFRARANAALTAAQAVLAEHVSRTPAQILRANTLPFRPLKLAQRAPKTTPTITPTYLTPAESLATPQAADTGDTVDAPLNEEILRQARELDYDYIRIYEFVRNNVRTEWYAGAMKGAVGTLRQRAGNDIDQANLLIALFRASGLASRYVHGVIELPIEQVGSSLGLSDPQKVVAALQAAGVAFTPLVRGGRVAAVQVEHTWVSAHAPYTNYRGAVVDASGKTWVPLVPAVKSHANTEFNNAFAQAGLTSAALTTNYLSTQQTGTPLQGVRTSIETYLQGLAAGTTYPQIIGATTINSQTVGLLPNTLPVSVVAVTGESAALTDIHRQLVRIVVRQGAREADKSVIDFTVPLSTLASERVTLSYMPATMDDHKTVNLFGGLDYTPAYLIRLRPQIKINGRAKAVAVDALSPGDSHRLSVQLISPARTEVVEQVIAAGSYHAIGLYAQGVARVVAENDTGDTEFTAARLLDRIAYQYVARWNAADTEYSALLNVAAVRPLPTVAIVSNSMKIETVLGRVLSMKWQGVTLDAALRISEPIARDAAANSAANWMRLSALEGSALELQVFSDEFLVDSISADKGLRLARLAGNEILTINSSNAAAQLASANLSSEVEADIANWARLGFTIEVPRNPVTHRAWTGAVWRVQDPATSAAGYFIAGGLAGGASTEPPETWSLEWLEEALAGANSPPPNNDPLAGAHIMVRGGDFQTGTVGQELDKPLTVIVRDAYGGPVKGAAVTFRIASGGGTLLFESPDPYNGVPRDRSSDAEATVLTNYLGLATVRLQLGRSTRESPTFATSSNVNENAVQVGENVIDVSVATRSGDLALAKPYVALAFPDIPASLSRTNSCCVAGALPDSTRDVINIAVNDQFGNPVSNAVVTFALSATGGTPGFLSGYCNACGQGTTLNIRTTNTGASVAFIMGTALDYTLTASTPQVVFPYSTTYRLNTVPGLVYHFTIYKDSLGRSVAAAAPSMQLAAPINGGFTNYSGGSTRAYKRWPVENVEHLSPVGAQFSTPQPQPSPREGYYTSTMRMSLAPGFNTGAQRALFHNPDHDAVKDEDYNELHDTSYPVTQSFFLTEAFSVEASLDALLLNQQVVQRVGLNEGGYPQGQIGVRYSIRPSTYQPASLQLQLLLDGEPISSVYGDTTQTSGAIPIPRDFKLNPEGQYSLRLVLNPGSLFEVKSDERPLPLSQRIIRSYSPSLHLKREVDVLNQRSCAIGSGIDFSISQRATMTLVASFVSNPNAQVTVFTDQYEAGSHRVSIDPSDLSPAHYTFKLHAVSAVTGESEEVAGTIISEFKVTNRLPVGHTVVKGVNIKYGQLVVGATDLTVPGRGVPLEFRRTYASNAPFMPGVMGSRWSHSYESKITTGCGGSFVVEGGEGSGMTFVPDGSGGLRPLKGYHGTLVQNLTDLTFDFYSKDGTRFHYRKFTGRDDWDLDYIQDTNLNVTKLAYDPASSIPKLMTVEDPAKRTLKFTYAMRTFGFIGSSRPVLTKVEGPDGQVVEFAYDAQGNLVEAKREAIKVERYAYSPLTESPVTSQVLSDYTDPNGHVTHYTFNDATVTVNPAGGASFQMGNAFVTSVRDPEGGTTQFAYDQDWHRTTVTDPRNNATVYTMNDYGSPLSIQDPAGTTRMTWATDDVVMTSRTDANDVRTDFTYDTDGNVLTESVAGGTVTYTYREFNPPYIKNRVGTHRDRENRLTTFTYDTRGNLTEVLDAEGGVTRHGYAANGDRISTTDPRGFATRFTYDRFGMPESVRNALGGAKRFEHNERGYLLSSTDELNRKSTMDYDTLGRAVRKVDALGNARELTYDAVGNKLTEQDENDHTTRWTYDDEDRVTRIDNAAGAHKSYTYDLVGNKTGETDWRGNETTFAYDDANRLTTKTEPLGRVTRFTYDPVGNVLTQRDARDHVTTYEYDELNRRTKTIDAKDGAWLVGYDRVGNKTSETDALNRVTSYEYDRLNRPTRKTEPLGRISRVGYDANGNKTSETDPNGNVSQAFYDELNRVSKQRDALGNESNFEYDAVGNLTVVIDARLSRTRNEYDALNRKVTTVDPAGKITRFEYDDVGNKTAEVWANGNRVTLVYDEVNRPVSVADTLGTISTTTYDADGRPLEVSDANGHTTTHTYDALGQLTQMDMPEARTVVYGYDLVGNKTSERDPRNFTTTFVYDELNRLTRSTDPLQRSIVLTYDAVGNKLTETDRREHTTDFEYDALNRLRRVVDPLDHEVLFTYDLNGNKKSETDKRGTLTAYNYDAENRLTETRKDGLLILSTRYDEVGNKEHETDANGNVTTYVYDERNLALTESRPLAAVSRFEYDAMGDRSRARDPENRITQFAYDLRRRLLTQTDFANQETRYTYDGVGNRLTTRKPKGNTWTSTYDAANRLATITDPESGVTRFTYDGNGNKLTQVDAENHTTTYEYDELNRQTAMIYADTRRMEFRYDANGNRVGLTDAKGLVFSYTFDELNRETLKSYPLPNPATGDDIQSIANGYDANGNITSVTESYSGATGTRVTTRSYDRFDRLTEVTDAFGERLRYRYDANGNRTSLTDSDGKVTSYSFDALNRVATVTNAAGVTSYEYDRSSLPTRTTYPNGTLAVTTYDNAMRTATISNRQGASIISIYSYTYDANGNRLTQQETNGGPAETTTYTYDDVDRLLSAAYPDKTTTYTYDLAYNRLTEVTVDTGGVTQANKTFGYNSRNQLTSITDGVAPATNTTYEYDFNGNQTIKTRNGSVTTFVYDVRDQLISVRQDATTLGLFRYDYQGLRVRKDMGGQIVRYTYDDDSVLLQSDNAGATVAKFDYGADRLLSMTHATEPRQFYLFDAIGSVSNLANQAGTVQARYQYDAFGNPLASAGSSYNRFAFTGHERDAETGLYNFKARYYDPEVGRFASQDPYEGEAGSPPSLHRYLYAFANPSVYIDLTGYAAFNPFLRSYFEDGKETRTRLDFTKRYAAAKGLNIELPPSLWRTSEALGDLGHGLRALEIDKRNARFSAVLLIEEGDTPESVMKYMREQLGAAMRDKIDNEAYWSDQLEHRLGNVAKGDLIDMSDFWQEARRMSYDRAAQDPNGQYWADVYYNPGRVWDGSVPLFSAGLAAHNLNYQVAADPSAPPLLRDYHRRSMVTGVVAEAMMLALPAKGAKPAGGKSLARTATANLSDVGSRIYSSPMMRRLAEEAEGALSQANRLVESGSTQTPWARRYQRLRGSNTDDEFLARRNALHQEAEELLKENRYFLEAQEAGAKILFNKGSLVGAARKGPLRPDIQIQLPGGGYGVIDFTTPGQANKIFKYVGTARNPYLINVVVK